MTMFTAIDHAHMAEALRLAAQGLYTTQPNPRVGCVIAHGERVIGRGFHARAGEPHAEVHALAEAGAQAHGATAYVTLEPCAHHGRTGPCADALLRAGIARVVVACEDPFDQVDGLGLARLREARVIVEVGLMRREARELNVGFFSRIERGRPFVRLKIAASLDGRIALADGSSKWITGDAARADVQRWRARASAIVTGVGTVLADDPQMNVRLTSPHQPPLRVVLDFDLRTPPGARVLQGSPPLRIYCARHADADRSELLRAAGADIVRVDGWVRQGSDAARMDLAGLLADLARCGVNEVHVEAGARLSGAFVDAGLVDELLIYQHACLLGAAARPLLDLPSPTRMAERQEWQLIETRSFGADWCLRLRPAAKESQCSPD
jgi:diaminohydroxyphosphoribosylaminopyrimidine deaminase / 5-amino-6-(5-phosphoribosylamino)uracil reductase